MPPPGQVTSSLALWLHLRRRPALGREASALIAAPAGKGRLIVVHVSEGGDVPTTLRGLIQALLAKRPGLRFVFTGARLPDQALPADLRATHLDTPHNPAAAGEFIAALEPGALLLLGDQLPAALITAMSEQRLPVILAEARLVVYGQRGIWRSAINRGLIRRVDRILIPDEAVGIAARRFGADPERIELIGPVTETLPPLHANEAERGALAEILRGRYIWLAAAPTMAEVGMALIAHQIALQHNHRALLILAGLPDEAVPHIRSEAEALGLACVLRSEDEDPEADDHVLIAEDPYEMGLWYRLAPVCFMGGTLARGSALPPRHPFEPAALGSAIIHGPLAGAHAAEWVQLSGAAAARQISDAETLGRAVADLSAPDRAAMLAGSAWAVSTGGAAVLQRIADTVIDAMEGTA